MIGPGSQVQLDGRREARGWEERQPVLPMNISLVVTKQCDSVFFWGGVLFDQQSTTVYTLED